MLIRATKRLEVVPAPRPPTNSDYEPVGCAGGVITCSVGSVRQSCGLIDRCMEEEEDDEGRG